MVVVAIFDVTAMGMMKEEEEEEDGSTGSMDNLSFIDDWGMADDCCSCCCDVDVTIDDDNDDDSDNGNDDVRRL